MDTPYYSGAACMGRNKEITNEHTVRAQAEAAIARARTSTKDGKIRPSIGNTGKEPKAVTTPGLSV